MKRARRRGAATRRLGAAVAAVALAAALGACGGSPISLSLRSDSVSACYRAFPVAKMAIDDPKAKLHGVHRVPVDKLRTAFPSFAMPPGDDDTQVCVFSFDGHFAPGQVKDAPPNEQGTIAVVVVSSKDLKLVNSFVGDQIPHGFGKRLTS